MNGKQLFEMVNGILTEQNVNGVNAKAVETLLLDVYGKMKFCHCGVDGDKVGEFISEARKKYNKFKSLCVKNNLPTTQNDFLELIPEGLRLAYYLNLYFKEQLFALRADKPLPSIFDPKYYDAPNKPDEIRKSIKSLITKGDELYDTFQKRPNFLYCQCEHE